MKLIFRYDDYSAAERQPFEIDQKVFELFASFGIPLIVGVTPCMAKNIRDTHNTVFYSIDKDKRRIELLQEKLTQGWQLALHGYSHQRTIDQDGTEFLLVHKDIQRKKIIEGLIILRKTFTDVPIDVFIPPWNSYDEVTVTCLQEIGFSILCGGNVKYHKKDTKLAFAPSLMSMRDLADYINFSSIDKLIQLIGSATLIITLHEYEFRTPECADFISFDEAQKLLEKVAEANIITEVLSSNNSNSIFVPQHRRAFYAQLYWLQQLRLPYQQYRLQWVKTIHSELQKYNLHSIASTIVSLFWWIDTTYWEIRSYLGVLKRFIKNISSTVLVRKVA